MIKTFYFNPYRECTYIIYKERACTREEQTIPAIIIDCGAYDERERQRLSNYIRDNHLRPVAHLVTHTHPDHVCGMEWLEDTFGIQSIIFPEEGPLQLPSLPEDESLWSITVLRTPGHKEDCVCYLFSPLVEESGEVPFIFTGDTLFQESIGRTDLPGGDMSQLMTSLRRLAQLPPALEVYPGHGYPTTIEHELQYNPYL